MSGLEITLHPGKQVGVIVGVMVRVAVVDGGLVGVLPVVVAVAVDVRVALGGDVAAVVGVDVPEPGVPVPAPGVVVGLPLQSNIRLSKYIVAGLPSEV